MHMKNVNTAHAPPRALCNLGLETPGQRAAALDTNWNCAIWSDVKDRADQYCLLFHA
jgi:hypothetical protein